MTRIKNSKLPLHYQIILALILGFVFGYYVPEWTTYTNWMGVIFLRLLNMVVIPLIICSIINGLISLGQSKSMGQITRKALGVFLFTTLLAIVTGFSFVLLFKPGIGTPFGLSGNEAKIAVPQSDFKDVLLNIVPKNIFEALSQGQMLSIIFFALVFGYFITKSKDETQVFLGNFFESVLDVIMRIVLFIMKLAPLGVFGIASGEISRQISLGNDIGNLISRVGMLILVVIGALLFHGLVNLSLVLKFIGKVNPVQHLKNMATPLITAFSTASTSATMPLTMEALEKNNGVSPKIVGFTIPLGTSINLNGTALYESIIVIFIAQIYGIHLGVTQLILVFFLSFLGAIGIGIPMAFLITIVVILKTVGLPLEGLALILPIDRLLDMFRASVNTYSGSCVATVVAKLEGEKLNV